MKDEKNQVTATTTKNENNVAENNKKAKKYCKILKTIV